MFKRCVDVFITVLNNSQFEIISFNVHFKFCKKNSSIDSDAGSIKVMNCLIYKDDIYETHLPRKKRE